jgi:arginase family enzyme
LGPGLAERLGARHGTRLAIPAFDPTIDAATGLLNPHGLRDHASRLADAVGAVLDQGAFPVVLGGDCTILLGITLALRRRGRYGLLFLDGHADFYQPEAEPTGEAASMELALVTGRGPDLVTDLEGRGPLLCDEDVVVFGFRDADHAAAEGSQPLAPTIQAMDLPSVRDRGGEGAGGDVLQAAEAATGAAEQHRDRAVTLAGDTELAGDLGLGAALGEQLGGTQPSRLTGRALILGTGAAGGRHHPTLTQHQPSRQPNPRNSIAFHSIH